MEYQAIKHNKTGTRLLGMHGSLSEAVQAIQAKGARFDGISYMGGFPTFRDERGTLYSVQGSVSVGASRVVCSLDKKELEAAGFVG